MKNKINNSMISNKRVYISIAIVLLVIFIIGIIALGVFKIGRGGDTPTPTYYSYKIDNSNLTSSSSLESDDKTYIATSEIKYHEVMTLVAANNASIGAFGHANSYLFAGNNISFTLTIEDESYHLSAVAITKIMIADDDPGDIYQLNEYETEYSSESKSYKVTLNNTEVRYIHSIELKYAVGKK